MEKTTKGSLTESADVSEKEVDWAARRQASHNALRLRTLSHMRNRTTDLAEGPMEVEPSIYVNPARFEAEKRIVFQGLPILAALTQEIPNPGDTLLFDVLGPSIFLVRNKEGKVNAFLNMCSHRGAKIVRECGNNTRLKCPFHGWMFDLNGKLAGLPGAKGFVGINHEERGLIPIPVSEWHGMIFVRATPGGAPIDVAAWLGEFGEEIAHLELGKAKPAKSGRIEADANWKYCWDTYGESYHFATLHPTTIGARSYTNMMVYQPYGIHWRLGFPRNEFMEYADRLPENEWPPSDYGGLYFIFPNVAINVNSFPDGGQFYGISRVFPGESVGHSVTLMTTCQPAHHAHPDLSKWEKMHDFIENVVRTEDYSVSKDGQHNLQYAPKGFTTLFGANEIVLQEYHRNLERILAEGQ